MARRTSKPLVALLLLLSSTLFYAASLQKIAISDDMADTYFAESIRAATIAYATTRGVNAVVSVIKESELNLAPAGVGLTIAAGQLLDPIDDMTERLSSLLVAAIASLGIQKIGFEISALVSFKAIALLLLLAIPLLRQRNAMTTLLLDIALKSCFILLLLRFMLPLSALVSDAVYKHWLQPDIEASLTRLTLVSDSYQQMATLSADQNQGLFSSLTDTASQKVTQTQQSFTHMVAHVEQIIAALMSLMTAYLTIFVVQIILLPLFMLWLLLALFRSEILDEMVLKLTKLLTPEPQKPRKYISQA